MRGVLTMHDVNEIGMRDDWWAVLSGWVDAQRGGKPPVTAETITTLDVSRRPALKAVLDKEERLEGFFTRTKGQPLSNFADGMLALIKVAKSYVEFEAGQGIGLDGLLDELQEIVDGNARGIAVRDVRRALNHARQHFPQIEIPEYPSEGDIVSAAPGWCGRPSGSRGRILSPATAANGCSSARPERRMRNSRRGGVSSRTAPESCASPASCRVILRSKVPA